MYVNEQRKIQNPNGKFYQEHRKEIEYDVPKECLMTKWGSQS